MDGRDGEHSNGGAGKTLHHKGLDPVWLAQSKLRRRKYDDCIAICTSILEENPLDKAVWFLKCRAMTLRDWIDDTDLEEEGIGDLLLDDNATADAPRPGTSLKSSSNSGANSNSADPSVRPVSSSGRPLTGFARPSTGSSSGGGRQSIGSEGVKNAFKGGRPGTSRPVTTLGRQVRLGTASMASQPGGVFIDANKLDIEKYSSRKDLAKVLCDYLLYHDHNPKMAMELCAKATVKEEFKDWWWKARLGKCYYQLGLLREAEGQFKSSLRQQAMVVSQLELCKIYIRLDQPRTALTEYAKSQKVHPYDNSLLIAAARVYDMLNDTAKGAELYKQALMLESTNVEAIACIASQHFYTDQPEIALQFYKRLAQMGYNSAELWNNMGLCSFYSSQYHTALQFFSKALEAASDDNMADVWYNIGHVAIGIGDLGLAYQTYKMAVSVDHNHAESFNNLGVLELRNGGIFAAKSNFSASQNLAPYLFESFFNAALVTYKLGDYQESYKLIQKSLAAYPNHFYSKEVLRHLDALFSAV